MPDVPFSGERQLRKNPCREKQQGEYLLGFVLEQNPAGEGCNGPEQNRRRPVFLNVEDLPHQRNGGASGNGSHCVQRCGKAMIMFARPGPAQVKQCDHGDDDRVAQAGSHIVPMSRDK